jgi:hypothetical protein
MRTVQSFVRGEWCQSNTTIADINPAHPSTPVAQVSLANKQVAEQAVQAAVDLAPTWRNTPAPAGGEILRRAADILQQRIPEIARDLASSPTSEPLRFFECPPAELLSVMVPEGPVSARLTNLMEEPYGNDLRTKNGKLVVPFHPFEIVSIRVNYPSLSQ